MVLGMNIFSHACWLIPPTVKPPKPYYVGEASNSSDPMPQRHVGSLTIITMCNTVQPKY
jgi:hypothetical protein